MNRQIALGTLVKVDHDANTVFTTVACVRTLTPPANDHKQADATCITDTLEQMLNGIETSSEFTFNQFWEPTDTNCLMIDTLRSAGTTVNWQIVFPFATPKTASFSGHVKATTPDQLDNNTVISRSVTVQRDSAIAYT